MSLDHAPHATHGSLRATLVVEAPGVPAFTHVYKKFGARVDKWPDPGDVLPVEVDPADPTEVEVLWDDLPTARESAAHQAEQLAAHLRQQQAQPGGMPTGAMPPGGLPPDAEAAGLGDMVSQLQQMFPGAVVNVGTEPAPGPPPTGGVNVVASQSDADPVERLEKLARLRTRVSWTRRSSSSSGPRSWGRPGSMTAEPLPRGRRGRLSRWPSSTISSGSRRRPGSNGGRGSARTTPARPGSGW